MGVVSGCCCKEVYRYSHNNYYFSLLHLYNYIDSIIMILVYIRIYMYKVITEVITR